MDAIVKASLYIGTVLLVGAGGYVHFVVRPTKVSRTLLIAVLLGLGLIVVGSILNLTLTVMNALGSRFDTAFLWKYATNTQHGKMTFIRLGLAVLLVPLALITRWRLIPRWRWLGSFLFSLAALGFLATFSILSHAAVMDGTLPFFADLIHFSAASLWIGAVMFSAFSSWKSGLEPHQLQTHLKRVSTIALVSVLLLVSTGIYTSLIHIKMFTSFVPTKPFAPLFETGYGRILLVKVAVFSLVFILAALNRWYFMPNLLAKRVAFQRVLLVEVFLLVTVLVITGLLTVTALPHE
jgi:putative copper export protein